MAEYSTIARPYAEGVFELAKDAGNMPRWSEMLEYAAAVARDPSRNALLGSPPVPREQVADLFIEICGDNLDEQGRNLIRLLAENRRLMLLPQIAEQYNDLRAKEEATLHVKLVAAHAVSDEVRSKLVDAIGRKLNRKVTLSTETDASLIGGAVIRAGDMVIDGSVRGRLTRLAASLSR